MTRIGPNILRYEDGQYYVNTGMSIFYTHIFVNIYIYVKKKTKWGYWKISWSGEVGKSDHVKGEIQTWDHYIHQDMLEADLSSEAEFNPECEQVFFGIAAPGVEDYIQDG